MTYEEFLMEAEQNPVLYGQPEYNGWPFVEIRGCEINGEFVMWFQQRGRWFKANYHCSRYEVVGRLTLEHRKELETYRNPFYALGSVSLGVETIECEEWY